MRILYNTISWSFIIFLFLLGCSRDIKFKDGWSDAKQICYRSDLDYVLNNLNNGKSIAIDNSNNVYIVFRRREKDSQGGWQNFGLYCKRLIPIPDGMRPEKDVLVRNEPTAINPTIAINVSGEIKIFYEAEREGKSYIFSAKSTDLGKTWGSHLYFLPTENGGRPSVMFDLQNRTHIAYRTRQHTKYLRVNSNENIEKDTALHWTVWGPTNQPSIIIDNFNRIHITWSHAPMSLVGNEIKYIRSDSTGNIWSQVVCIRGVAGLLEEDPSATIVVDRQSGVHVFWNGISYRCSKNGGESWDSIITIASGNRPSVAIDASDGLHVVYEYEGAIFYSCSNDRGSTWSSPIRVSDQGVNTARSPFIAIDGNGRKHVVWQQYEEDDEVNCLYYKVGR